MPLNWFAWPTSQKAGQRHDNHQRHGTYPAALDHYREQQGFTWDGTATRCGWTTTELDKVLAHRRGPNINELDTQAVGRKL